MRELLLVALKLQSREEVKNWKEKEKEEEAFQILAAFET